MVGKNARLTLGIVLVALVALLTLGGNPLWNLISLKKIPIGSTSFGHTVFGWVPVKRWTNPPVSHGQSTGYYVETGLKAWEQRYENGKLLWLQSWDFAGTLRNQARYGDMRPNPPWWSDKELKAPP